MGVLQNLREELTGVVALLVLGLGLADLWIPALVPGVPFWVIFVVGYAVVLPLVAIALGEGKGSRSRRRPDRDRDRSDDVERVEDGDGSPLERLKRRYAEGELSDEEFERRLERLLETGDETTAAEYLQRERRDHEREEA